MATSITVLAVLAAFPLTPSQETGPRPEVMVLLDGGHNNLKSGTTGSRKVLAGLEVDGYRTRELTEAFSDEALSGIDFVVVAVPLGDENALRASAGMDVDAEVARRWRKPIVPAYSPGEIDALQRWVEAGGALLIVGDHFPFLGAVEQLLTRFGIEVSDGFAVDETRLPSLPADVPPLLGTAGELVFSRAGGTLSDQPVTNGRNEDERVEVVGTFVGAGFRLPSDGQSLLTFGPKTVSLLPEVAWEFSKTTPGQRIAGWSQGGLLEVGQGRVAVFGELAILADESRMARTHPDMQNAQLLRNVIRWLSAGRD